MSKYAAVYFGPDEESGYRTFLRAMAGLGIIGLSKEQIEQTMKEFLMEKVGAANRLVLPDDKVQTFESVMNIWLPKKDYEITDDPNDESFASWLKEKEKRIDIR